MSSAAWRCWINGRPDILPELTQGIALADTYYQPLAQQTASPRDNLSINDAGMHTAPGSQPTRVKICQYSQYAPPGTAERAGLHNNGSKSE